MCVTAVQQTKAGLAGTKALREEGRGQGGVRTYGHIHARRERVGLEDGKKKRAFSSSFPSASSWQSTSPSSPFSSPQRKKALCSSPFPPLPNTDGEGGHFWVFCPTQHGVRSPYSLSSRHHSGDGFLKTSCTNGTGANFSPPPG